MLKIFLNNIWNFEKLLWIALTKASDNGIYTKIRREYELRLNPEKILLAIAQHDQCAKKSRPTFNWNYLILLPEDEINNILEPIVISIFSTTSSSMQNMIFEL